MEMDRRRRLCRDEEMIGAGLGKGIEIALRFDDHQVHIKRLLRVASHRFDNHRSERDIRHKATIHDVDMDPVGAGCIDGADLVGEMAEICRQDRRCDDNRPLQISLRSGCHCRLPFDVPDAAATPEVNS